MCSFHAYENKKEIGRPVKERATKIKELPASSVLSSRITLMSLKKKLPLWCQIFLGSSMSKNVRSHKKCFLREISPHKVKYKLGIYEDCCWSLHILDSWLVWHRHKITVYVTPTAFHKASQKFKEVSGKEKDEIWNFRERQWWQMERWYDR